MGNLYGLSYPKVENISPETLNGRRLGEATEAEMEVPEAKGERKHITALFSDLSGYTALSDRFDREEVKEITSRIFAQFSEIIDKYEET